MVEPVDKVAGKVVGFISVIGKPLGKVIKAEGKVAGMISDHIHVKLPGNLQKGMNVMNKADKIMGYIPRRREFPFSEEDAFHQQDIGEAYYSRNLMILSWKIEKYLISRLTSEIFTSVMIWIMIEHGLFEILSLPLTSARPFRPVTDRPHTRNG